MQITLTLYELEGTFAHKLATTYMYASARRPDVLVFETFQWYLELLLEARLTLYHHEPLFAHETNDTNDFDALTLVGTRHSISSSRDLFRIFSLIARVAIGD